MNCNYIILLLAVLLAYTGCSTTKIAGTESQGNGSETIARGIIHSGSGSPVSGATVYLLSSSFNPNSNFAFDSQSRATTNSNGEYQFINVKAGLYNVESIDTSNHTGFSLQGITIGDTSRLVNLGTTVATKTSRVSIQFNKTQLHSGDYVFIPGTRSIVVIDSASTVASKAEFQDIPTGSYGEVTYVRIKDSLQINILSAKLLVLSGVQETIIFDNALSTFSQRLYLNTTQSGASVTSNIFGFPILIRLNASNFHFTQAKTDGSDIRFTKADGTMLAHAIERWDASSQVAEVWVKVDTVFGNNTSQFVDMTWGLDTASGSVQSNSESVFDTANGFAAVWHMNQQGGMPVLDATSNHYNGTPVGLTPASTINGTIGQGYSFDGTSNYIAINVPDSTTSKLNFPENGNYTVSAWVSLDTLYSGGQTEVIVEKGSRTPSEYVLSVNSKQEFSFMEYESSPEGWNYRYSPASAKVWTYVVGVKDGVKQYLYVNGICIDSVGIFTAGNLTRGSIGSVAIGRNPYTNSPQNYLKGMIDEVRMSSVVRSADWIKLCAMNQGNADKLIVIK